MYNTSFRALRKRKENTRSSVTRQQGFAFVPTAVFNWQQNGVTVFKLHPLDGPVKGPLKTI
jgi:hypothetical protein